MNDWKTLLPSHSERNIHKFAGGCYLAAGAHQFNSLWTRDFCFSSRGLFRLRKPEIVHDQLELILSNLQSRNGFKIAPKVMDSSSATRQARCVSAVINKYCGLSPSVPLNTPLRPEFEDERGSIAIDSNLLVLLTAYDYLLYAGAEGWWRRRLQDLVQLYKYYDHKQAKDGDALIVQPPFSDWQDSARRTGKSFYTNLLYYLVSKRLAGFPEFGIVAERLAQLRSAIEDRFFDRDLGIYRSLVSDRTTEGQIRLYPQFSLEANLLAIDLGYFDDDSDPRRSQKVYAALKASYLWRGRARLPGFVSFPSYPADWIYWIVRVARLPHYHDAMYWSWLIALSAKIAWKMKDYSEALRIAERLGGLAKRDGSIVEVYRPAEDLAPVSSWLYDAERPFSWGAAFVLDLVRAISGKPFISTKPKSGALTLEDPSRLRVDRAIAR